MAIIIKEQQESRLITINSDGFTEKRVFHIKGQEDPTEYATLLAPDIGTAHPVFDNTILKQIDLRPEPAVELLTAEYSYGARGKRESKNRNKETWQWSLTAQSANINSVEQKTADTTNKHTFQTMYDNTQLTGGDSNTTAIGIDGDNVTGTDVYRPYGALRVTKTYESVEIDLAFRQQLYKMQNTLNDAAWSAGEFQKEEILFLGAEVTYDYAAQTATVVYSFLFGPTRASLTFDVIAEDAWSFAPTVQVTMTDVPPFDYIWMPFKEYKLARSLGEPAEGYVARTIAEAVYRDKLYLTSDFSLLGLVGPE